MRPGELGCPRIAQESRIQTFVDVDPVADLTHTEACQSHPIGFIGLQVLSHKVADIEIGWRTLRIKELEASGQI